MAYITGTAATAADIVTAIRSACTTNGWTLTNDILSKGTCFVRVWSPAAGYVSITSGRGQTGGAGSTLTGQSNAAVRGVGTKYKNVAFTYPMTYHIHVFANPDEVYVFLNYNTSYYTRIMFGQSNVPGLVGTGNFYDATFAGQQADNTNTNQLPDNRISDGVGSTEYAAFPFGTYPGFGNGGVDHSLDTNPNWLDVKTTYHQFAQLLYTPNQWNGESVLLPVQAYQMMTGGFRALVLELQNLRMLSMDNLAPEQIITLGTDKWKIYPGWRKGDRATSPINGNNGGLPAGVVANSTVYAVAVRYDGP